MWCIQSQVRANTKFELSPAGSGEAWGRVLSKGMTQKSLPLGILVWAGIAQLQIFNIHKIFRQEIHWQGLSYSYGTLNHIPMVLYVCIWYLSCICIYI
jgi:hypothetical protein